MPIDLTEISNTTIHNKYTYVGPPNVQIDLMIDQASSNSGMQIRISNATGAAQLKNVLQVIINKLSAEFGV